MFNKIGIFFFYSKFTFQGLVVLLVLGMYIPSAHSIDVVSSFNPNPEVVTSISPTSIEILQVERTKQLSIPTIGKARVLILDPSALKIEKALNNLVELKGVRKGNSLIHVLDESGIRTYRIDVVELNIIRERIKKGKENIRRQKLDLGQRSLKIRYEASHRNLDSGIKLSQPDLQEETRTRVHQGKVTMALPFGDFDSDIYIESRRDKSIGKEVTQLRNLSFKLKNVKAPILGEVDLVAVDNFLDFTRFTLRGRKIRGFGLHPAKSRLRIGKKGRLDWTYVEGQVRQGSILDSRAGFQPRGGHNHVRANKVVYHLWDEGKIYGILINRYGKLATGRSNNVVSGGFDFKFRDYLSLDGELATNGPGSAVRLNARYRPLKWVTIRERFIKVSKRYRSVEGTIGTEGQTRWENTVNVNPPFFNNAISLTFQNVLSDDTTDRNANNFSEMNESYSLSGSVRFPFKVRLRGRIFYKDESASSQPFTNWGYSLKLAKTFYINKYGIKRINLSIGNKRDKWEKSIFIPGFDASLEQASVSVGASLFDGFTANVSLTKAILKEEIPSDEPGSIFPSRFTVSLGYGRKVKFPIIKPMNVNVIFRYENVRNTFNRIHQSFSDDDRLEGVANITMPITDTIEVFSNWNIRYRKSETIKVGREADVEVTLFSGVRALWDTKLVFPQPGSIDGVVFQDININGVRDPGEPGIGDVRVYVEGGKSFNTTSEGSYRLKRIKEGSVTLKVDQSTIPQGAFFTTASSQDVFVLPKEALTVDFGVSTEVEVKGRIFNDVNQNKVYDEGLDEPIQNVVINLGSGQSARTSSEGYYYIRKVKPGENSVNLGIMSIPDGYQSLVPIRKDFDTSAGQIYEYDVPLKAQRSISGYVFEDVDGNGRMSGDERGMSGIVVRLGSEEIMTNKDGFYVFRSLTPGNYEIQVDESLTRGSYTLTSRETFEIEISSQPTVKKRFDFGFKPILKYVAQKVSSNS